MNVISFNNKAMSIEQQLIMRDTIMRYSKLEHNSIEAFNRYLSSKMLVTRDIQNIKNVVFTMDSNSKYYFLQQNSNNDINNQDTSSTPFSSNHSRKTTESCNYKYSEYDNYDLYLRRLEYNNDISVRLIGIYNTTKSQFIDIRIRCDDFDSSIGFDKYTRRYIIKRDFDGNDKLCIMLPIIYDNTSTHGYFSVQGI